MKAADLFCGAGGFSHGLLAAGDEAGVALDLVAVNHWETAIATHAKNHPCVRHLCERLERVEPMELVPDGHLDLLLAAPECTSHSYSRGNRPISEQSRATAWDVLKWADRLNIKEIRIENVPAFREWGPTDARRRPIKSRKGETYRAFLDQIRALGYTVDDRVLCAADYGDPTTRKRLFIAARKGRQAPRWPDATHAPKDQAPILGRQPWRVAKDILDLGDVGESIFTRKRPLARATMQRILRGLVMVSGPELRPWIEVFRAHIAGRSIDLPRTSRPTPNAAQIRSSTLQ